MINAQLPLFELEEVENQVLKVVQSKPLRKIKSDNVRPPLRYPGSKYNASKFILPHIDILHNEYREPFLGSGAIFFTKTKSEINWLNDIDEELILTFRVISDPKKRELLLNKLSIYTPTKENFELLKNTVFTDEIDRAYRYFTLNRTAYSGIMNLPNFGFHPTKSVQPEKWPKRIEDSGKKLNGVRLTRLDYEEVILTPSVNKVLIFIDPPYFAADQKRAYLHSFSLEEHYRLLGILKSCSFNFCLTYDNCPEIKEMYSWANVFEYNWRYHTANSNATDRKMGRELIITNY